MADAADNLSTPPPVSRIGRLDSVQGVRRELVRLYKDLRHGRISVRVAGTGAYILTATAKILQGELLEHRVKVLEERADLEAPKGRLLSYEPSESS
jgi:hypothetical protein